MENNIEESVQVEMVRDNFKILLKLYFHHDVKLTKADAESLKELVQRIAKQYSCGNIEEAYRFFHEF